MQIYTVLWFSEEHFMAVVGTYSTRESAMNAAKSQEASKDYDAYWDTIEIFETPLDDK